MPTTKTYLKLETVKIQIFYKNFRKIKDKKYGEDYHNVCEKSKVQLA